MLKKYLDDALLLEEKGYAMYSALASEAQNPLSKKLFESLARQEQYHRDYINSYVRQTQFKIIIFDPLEETIKKLFESLDDKTRGKDLSQTEGIANALQMERDGYRLYQEAYARAETQEDKDFFTYLLSMENEHYESLANLYYYYTSNDQWISEDESKVWNWMNF